MYPAGAYIKPENAFIKVVAKSSFPVSLMITGPLMLMIVEVAWGVGGETGINPMRLGWPIAIGISVWSVAKPISWSGTSI